METAADVVARVLYVMAVWFSAPWVLAVIVAGWSLLATWYGLRRVLRLGGG